MLEVDDENHDNYSTSVWLRFIYEWRIYKHVIKILSFL